MRICYLAIYALLLTLNFPAWSAEAADQEQKRDEKVAQNLENVDFIIENLRTREGDIFGEAYYVKNHNDYPVRISMKIVDPDNVDAKIVPYTIIVEEQDRVRLGSVIKKDSEKEASWSYEWEVEPDLHALNVEKLSICTQKDEKKGTAE